ncbi:hypothetical protein [Methylosinus sporium]|uniref:hypothetical protein n=1 Tax=Methylosinus sporium TaxID=428 RepID=UPI00383B8A2C
MQSYDLKPVEWPESLAWIFDCLSSTAFQNFATVRMSSGHERRRPLHSPISGMAGRVTLLERDYLLLEELVKSARLFAISSRNLLVSFYCVPQIKSSIRDDKGSRYVLELSFVSHGD